MTVEGGILRHPDIHRTAHGVHFRAAQPGSHGDGSAHHTRGTVGPETDVVPRLTGRTERQHDGSAFHVLRGKRLESGKINHAQIGKTSLPLVMTGHHA